jgi:hypothetical protein
VPEPFFVTPNKPEMARVVSVPPLVMKLTVIVLSVEAARPPATR